MLWASPGSRHGWAPLDLSGVRFGASGTFGSILWSRPPNPKAYELRRQDTVGYCYAVRCGKRANASTRYAVGMFGYGALIRL